MRKILGIGIILAMVTSVAFVLWNPAIAGNVQYQYAIIRNPSSALLNQLSMMGIEVVHNYGSYVLVKYPAGGEGIKVLKLPNMKPVSYTMKFASGNVNPSSLTNLKGSSIEPGLYVVQLIGPPTPQWYETVKSLGKVVGYVPNYGYIIYIPKSTTIDDSFVIGVYRYQPSWKLGQSLIRELPHYKSNETIRIVVTLLPSVENPVTYAQQLAQKYGIKLYTQPMRMGGIIYRGGGGYRFQGEIQVSEIYQLITDPNVMTVDYLPELKLWNAMAAKVTNVELARDQLLNGLKINLTGKGQIVAIADTGLDTGNPNTVMADFAGRVLAIVDEAGDGDPAAQNLTGCDHGTHVAGTVAGSGVLSGSNPLRHYYNGTFAGMAPEATIYFMSIGYNYYGQCALNFPSIADMANKAYGNGSRIWTNSWGSTSNSYDTEAQALDNFTWYHKDFLILFAAGNSGPFNNTVGTPATAKNIITVGASENLDPNIAGQGLNQYSMASDMDQVAYFSSRGPTADGRIKPDLVAPGTGIVSDQASSMNPAYTEATWHVPIDNNNDGKTDYEAMQGTSMATPHAAGVMVLIRQYLVNYTGLTDPSAALMKAIALVGTDILPGYRFGGFSQGWGKIDIAGSLFPAPPLALKFWDWQAVSNGANWTQNITVTTSTAPLRVVLTWTDYPASTTASTDLVNDLDLLVIAPNGTVYHGNIIDNQTAASIPNPTTYDHLNNVEVVRVPHPAVGTWKIVVIGYNIVQDDPDGPGTLDQTFAVAVRGPIGPQKPENTKVTMKALDGSGYTYEPAQIRMLPNSAMTLYFNVTNWGTLAAHNYVIGYTSDNPNITVTFTQTSITNLTPGSSALVTATVSVGPSVVPGLYHIRIYARDENGYEQGIILYVSVFDNAFLPKKVVSATPPWYTEETFSTMAVDPVDGSLWVAYFRQNTSRVGNPYTNAKLGNGDNYDLVIARSTDGGRTWQTVYVLPNIDRMYNYGGSLQPIIDWFYWYPQMDISSDGMVYVAFSTLSHVYVVYGNTTAGFNYTTFENCQYTATRSIFSSTINLTLVYPWVTVITNRSSAWVVYTYYQYYNQTSLSSSTVYAYRSLKYAETTDDGGTWSNGFIGPYGSSANGIRQYMASGTLFNGKVYVFYSGLNPNNGESYYTIKYYVYNGTGWTGPYIAAGSSTSGPSLWFPSAFTDGKYIYVAYYSPNTTVFDAFGVNSWNVDLKYSSDGSTWSGPYLITNQSSWGYPVAFSGFNGKVWIGYPVASYYGKNNPAFNNRWPYYTTTLMASAFDPATGQVTERRYIIPGAFPAFQLDGDNDAHNGLYFSYTTVDQWPNVDVYVVAYNGTSFKFIWPTPMNNTKIDVTSIAPAVSTSYAVDGVTIKMNGNTYSMEGSDFNRNWIYNVTGLLNGTYTYNVTVKAIGETLVSKNRLFIVNTTKPTYVSTLLDGTGTQWKGDPALVAPGNYTYQNQTFIWKDTLDTAKYNLSYIELSADPSYLYMLVRINDTLNVGKLNADGENAYLVLRFDLNGDNVPDLEAVVDFSQYNYVNGTTTALNLYNATTGKNIGDSETLALITSKSLIELQIPRKYFGSANTIGISASTYITPGAGYLLGSSDNMTTSTGSTWAVVNLALVPMLSSAAIILVALFLLVYFRRR